MRLVEAGSVGVFTDVVSGKRFDRSGLAQLIDTPVPATATASPVWTADELVFHVFGAIAHVERRPISERTRDGIAAPRKRGRSPRRPRSIWRRFPPPGSSSKAACRLPRPPRIARQGNGLQNRSGHSRGCFCAFGVVWVPDLPRPRRWPCGILSRFRFSSARTREDPIAGRNEAAAWCGGCLSERII